MNNNYNVNDLLVRMSMDGIEIAESLREIAEGCYHIKGTLVTQHRSVGESVEFWLPLDTREVRLTYVVPDGYVLREEKDFQPGSRAWVDELKPPNNEVKL